VILEKNTKAKIKALFKEKQNSFVSGYKVGTKEQIKETIKRKINKVDT
jgi:biotin operon repressor